MSREIKFRAWLKPRWEDDEDAGKMYYDIQDSYDTIGNVKPYDPMTDFSSWLEDDVAIVEQYTGLKDENGNPIYEGDKINAIFREDIVEDLTVAFNDGIFGCMIDVDKINADYPAKQIFIGLGGLQEIEVIDNIHENKELLK